MKLRIILSTALLLSSPAIYSHYDDWDDYGHNNYNNDPYGNTEEEEKDPYTFDNLVGDIPQDVLEITDFIHNAEKYTAMGARMPKGILLVGPPGTGKTSIARAIAGEADAKFISVSGSEFLVMWVGEGARKVRELFQQARDAVKYQGYKKAIIFIDELDSFAGDRSAFHNGHSAKVLNELLAQMSGFNEDDKVFVIGATNRVDSLDPAIKRSGRFDRIVEINAPDLSSRKQILEYYTEKIKHDKSIDFDRLAYDTAGLTPADLESLVNEAAIRAVRDNKPKTNMTHFESALEAIIKRNEFA